MAASRITLGLSLFALSALPAVADAFGPYTVRAQEVRSTNDRGKSTHQSQRFASAEDRFIVESSIRITGEGTGKNQSCSYSLEKVPLKVKSGNFDIQVEVVKSVTVTAHAETGSGVTNIGKTAWRSCVLTGEAQEYN